MAAIAEHYGAKTNLTEDAVELDDGQVINASGHVQEVNRNFGLVSIAGVGIVTGCMWPTLGSTIVIALYNGGPPGKLACVSALATMR